MKKKIKNMLLKIQGETLTEELVRMGLKVGSNFNRQVGCIIDYAHCWLIEIGDNVTLAPRVHILAHDASTYKLLGYSKIGLVKIGDNVFIGANSTILPNVEIGDNSIIGANSIVVADIPENVVAAGNPARVLCTVDEYKAKMSSLMNKHNTFDLNWTTGKITREQKNQMKEILSEGIGFVK